jgi:hypothetical protein
MPVNEKPAPALNVTLDAVREALMGKFSNPNDSGRFHIVLALALRTCRFKAITRDLRASTGRTYFRTLAFRRQDVFTLMVDRIDGSIPWCFFNLDETGTLQYDWVRRKKLTEGRDFSIVIPLGKL